MRDWRGVATEFDRLAFDANATGAPYLPLLSFSHDRQGKVRTFVLPTYVGDTRFDRNNSAPHEGITCIGAVLGASLVDIDKSAGPVDWVALCDFYFDARPGRQIVGNRDTAEAGSFWYALFPNILYLALSDLYPKETALADHSRTAALRWADITEALSNGRETADFDHTGFDLKTSKPKDNGKWKEPDAAAGTAWILWVAYQRWPEPRLLENADRCMRFLHERPQNKNPLYEVMLPFGALTAARMNAELGRKYDLDKIINWCFDRSNARIDFAVLVERWAGYDISGLAGASNRPPGRKAGGGYVFAMNSFVYAWPLVPIARYDARYAHDLGKWMLNTANAARLFYSDAHPAERQSCPNWQGDPKHVIAYEGIKHWWDKNEELFASGDPLYMKWGPKTDFSLYGSVFAGVYGALIDATNDTQILKLDLLKTDFGHPKAWPSFLLYNPHDNARNVSVDVGSSARDVYDAVSGRFLAKNVINSASIDIPADTAVVAVVVPSGGKMTVEPSGTFVDGVVVDYARKALVH